MPAIPARRNEESDMRISTHDAATLIDIIDKMSPDQQPALGQSRKRKAEAAHFRIAHLRLPGCVGEWHAIAERYFPESYDDDDDSLNGFCLPHRPGSCRDSGMVSAATPADLRAALAAIG
jgi:hypothetical protein